MSSCDKLSALPVTTTLLRSVSLDGARATGLSDVEIDDMDVDS